MDGKSGSDLIRGTSCFAKEGAWTIIENWEESLFFDGAKTLGPYQGHEWAVALAVVKASS